MIVSILNKKLLYIIGNIKTNLYNIAIKEIVQLTEIEHKFYF